MDIARFFIPIIAGKKAVDSLLAGIAAWQEDATLVHCAGLEAAAFADNNHVSPNNLNFCTVIDTGVNKRIRQDGYVYGAKLLSNIVDANSSVKFIVLRLNGTDYDLVSTSETFALTSTGVGTYSFTTPIACLIGDYFGCVVMNSAAVAKPQAELKTAVGLAVAYKFADVTASNTLSAIANLTLDLEALTKRPYVVATGDSIPAGFYNRQGWYDAFTGAVTEDPVEQLQLLSPTMNYQNHSKGAQTWAWVRSTGVVSALATSPKYVIIHCGVNDLNTARTWEQVVADMDAVKVLCDAAGATMLVDEILPWTNGTDEQSATLRTWNAAYATWVAANAGTYLVTIHDAFGKVRAGTGELDDLADAYDDDGVHILLAGKQAMAAIWKAKLQAIA